MIGENIVKKVSQVVVKYLIFGSKTLKYHILHIFVNLTTYFQDTKII